MLQSTSQASATLRASYNSLSDHYDALRYYCRTLFAGKTEAQQLDIRSLGRWDQAEPDRLTREWRAGGGGGGEESAPTAPLSWAGVSCALRPSTLPPSAPQRNGTDPTWGQGGWVFPAFSQPRSHLAQVGPSHPARR